MPWTTLLHISLSPAVEAKNTKDIPAFTREATSSIQQSTVNSQQSTPPPLVSLGRELFVYFYVVISTLDWSETQNQLETTSV
jgi:hypothetical protein